MQERFKDTWRNIFPSLNLQRYRVRRKSAIELRAEFISIRGSD